MVIIKLLPFNLFSQELFPYNEPASNISKGVLGTRLFSESFKEIHTDRGLLGLRLMYGVSPKISVYLTVNASNHHGKNLPKDLINHIHQGSQTIYYAQTTQKGSIYPFRFNGFHLYTKYRFLSIDEKQKHFRMAAYLEGSNTKKAHDEAEPNLLDDTKGLGGGLIATYLKNRFAISLTSGLIFPGKYEETAINNELSTRHTEMNYGRALIYNLSLGYLLYPRKYKNYQQNNWNIYLEFMGKAYEAAQVFQNGELLQSESLALQSGHYIEIHPGIQKIVNSNFRIDLSVGFKLINQSYTRFTPFYLLGIQRYFFFKKKNFNTP